MKQLIAELDGLAEDMGRDGATGVNTVASASQQLARLERENAALRKALVNADELERYSGSDGHRQWGRCSAWLHPDDAVIIISAKALDAARKEAQP